MAQDSTSGYNSSYSTFYSKCPPIPLPPKHDLRHHHLHLFMAPPQHHQRLYRRLQWSPPLLLSALVFVDSLSRSLSSTSIGVRKGHVILILSPNSLSFLLICLSVMSLGALITTANPLNTTREISKQIGDSKPFLAFTTPELAHKLAGSDVSVVLLGEGSLGNLEGKKVNVLTTLEEMLKVGGE